MAQELESINDANASLESIHDVNSQLQQKPERAWSDVPLEAVKNIPGSALEFGKNIVQPILHPIDTAKSLAELGGGVLQHLGLMSGKEYQPAADAVGKFLMDRYGSIEGIKNTLATDPVGLAGDLSMVLTGGGSAAARAPGLIGKAGEIASTAGRYTNPLTPAAAVAAPAGRLLGRAAAEVAGLTTHVGPEPYIQAAKAGYEGGQGAQAFREHITGAAPAAEPVADAQQVLAQLRNERGVAYRDAMTNLGLNHTQPLNFNRVDNALIKTTGVHTFKGVPLDPPNVSNIRKEIAQAVQDWKMLPPNQYHTAEGLDALKKKIGGIRDGTQFGTPERVVANLAYNALKQTIVNQAPEYARIMRGYELASTRLDELHKELSIPTPDKGRVDTALRKLQSTLRNNVNTSFGRRKELADFLVRAGAPDLMYKLAGQALQPITPRGLGKLAASVGMEIGAAVGLTGGAGAAALGPAALLAGTMSPRLMGEGAYWGGVGARRLGQVTPPRAAFPPAAAVGQVEDAQQQYPSRQAGGGVPAIGGTGGRSPGATTPAGARAARQGAGQALQDGGAAGDQEADQGYAEGGEVAAQPGLRERWGAAQTGSIAGGGELTGSGKQSRNPAPLLRKDIVDTLRRHGINDKAVLSNWLTEGQDVDSRAEGGAVDADDGDEPQYFMPPEGAGRWPIAQTGPGAGISLGDEMRVRTREAQSGTEAMMGLFESGRLRINPKGWESFLANAPRSTNIEDRRGEPPVSKEEGDSEVFAGPTQDLSDSSLARALGYGSLHRYAPRVPLPRRRPHARGMQEGGGVEGEEKLPLPPAIMEGWDKPGGFEESAARTRRRAPVREPDPVSLAASQGRAGWKGMGRGMAEGLASLPERATHAAGELQRQGDVYDPGPALETAGWMLGARTPFMKQGDLGIFGGRGAKTANLDMLKRAEEMHAQGAAPESIWNQTGWALGPEGKWRFEIPDQAAFVHPTERIHSDQAASRPSDYAAGTLEDIIHHPEYFKAYPQFKDVPTSMELGLKERGAYIPPAKLGGIPIDKGSIEARAPGLEEARSPLLHEMQHVVQEEEGFAPGASPLNLPYTPRQLSKITKDYVELKGLDWSKLSPLERKMAEKQVRYDMYRMYAGETEARNVQARADFENRQVPPWKTEDVKREFQLVPASEEAARGVPVKGRKPFMLEERPEGVGAPGILRSEFDRPLFDYSRMHEVPDVPQFDLPRIIPARGVPEHILRLGDPRNMERTNAIVQMGMSHGGPEWYNTMPLRERYIGEVGAVKGPESHRSYLNYVGATSPRSPVPLNASVASYYDMLAAQGRPFPQPVFRGGNWSMPRGQLPEGYGSLAQATNARNAQMIREQGGWPSWTHFEKPKPPSFTSNLLGNYQPVTSDVHNVSMLNLRGPQGNRLIMPPHPYYGYIEQLQQGRQGAGQFIDLAPAQYQASGWIPWAAGYRDVGRYGDVTGGSPKKLEAYSQPFIRVVEDRVKNKARELGWSPEQTLRAFLRKEIAIVGVPAAAIPLLQDHLQQVGQEGN